MVFRQELFCMKFLHYLIQVVNRSSMLQLPIKVMFDCRFGHANLAITKVKK
jgi:hypothetical protein